MSDVLRSPEEREWQVLLLGGASAVGKSQFGYRLARHVGLDLTEADDFRIILEAMTSPADYPEFHLWRLQPEVANSMTEEEHLAFGRRYAGRMAQAIELGIANHVDNCTSVLLAGGGTLTPAFPHLGLPLRRQAVSVAASAGSRRPGDQGTPRGRGGAALRFEEGETGILDD